MESLLQQNVAKDTLQAFQPREAEDICPPLASIMRYPPLKRGGGCLSEVIMEFIPYISFISIFSQLFLEVDRVFWQSERQWISLHCRYLFSNNFIKTNDSPGLFWEKRSVAGAIRNLSTKSFQDAAPVVSRLPIAQVFELLYWYTLNFLLSALISSNVFRKLSCKPLETVTP